MGSYKIETIVPETQTLVVPALPFKPGAKVEVVVTESPGAIASGVKYPLRGKQPYHFDDPFTPVADEDWDVLK